MKRFLLSLSVLFALCHSSASAQLSSIIAGLRSLNAYWYTSASPSAPLQLWQEQQIHDSILYVMQQLYDTAYSLVPTAGNLDAVCHAGNITTTPVYITDSAAWKLTCAPGYLQFSPFPSGAPVIQLLPSGAPSILLNNGAGINQLFNGATSGTKINTFPNEGGAGLNGTLVTHVTKDSVEVSNAGNTATLSYHQIATADASGDYTQMLPGAQLNVHNATSGTGTVLPIGFTAIDPASTTAVALAWFGLTPALSLKESGFFNVITPSPAVSQNNNDTLENESGCFPLWSDTSGDPRGMGILPTIAYGNAHWAGSGSTATVVAKANATGLSAGVSIVSYTTPATPPAVTYRVGGYINVTAISGFTIKMSVAYTDENSTPLSVTFYGDVAGSWVSSISVTGDFSPSYIPIRAKGGTAIVIQTAISGSGTISYDDGATIEQLPN